MNTKNGICYIVGAGEVNPPVSPGACDFIIAADGGYDRLSHMGLSCDLLVGDLDSIETAPNDIETLRFPVRKNETDAHLAYLEGVKRGYSRFRLLGGVGGRADHTMANLALSLYASRRGHSLELLGDGRTCRVITDGSITVTGKAGDHLSVLAFGGDALGVKISGAEYELDGGTLLAEFPLGVSNSFKDSPVFISVERGSLLIITEEK